MSQGAPYLPALENKMASICQWPLASVENMFKLGDPVGKNQCNIGATTIKSRLFCSISLLFTVIIKFENGAPLKSPKHPDLAAVVTEPRHIYQHHNRRLGVGSWGYSKTCLIVVQALSNIIHVKYGMQYSLSASPKHEYAVQYYFYYKVKQQE